MASFFLRMLALCLFLFSFTYPASALAGSAPVLYPVPQEVRSDHYTIAVNGHKTPVVHAAGNLYLLNFDTAGPVTVSVTASDPHFWDRGVEVQPMRLGIRPVRRGATITFPLAGPEKLSISRPGDHFAEADMLFLFANPPDTSRIDAHTPGVRYYGPGVHHESVDARSGDTIYLAGGAVVFGSLNLWHVHDVHVLGRGMIVYDGPQTGGDDNSYFSQPNWHVIVMRDAHNIEIDGITTVVRSRTWQIQMKDSRGIGFYNFKAVAGVKADANQDGMDWLGGGDTTVRDSFFRASDDVFAAYGNWDGYTPELLRKPGPAVTNISIENTEVSTSISNIIRIGWPEKSFSSAHFHMRDVDVLDAGFGDCKVPFSFFELWADPGGVGRHIDYSFENIRLEDWYSLFQIRYPNPGVRDVRFRGVWAMDGPGMVASVLKGDVRGVSLEDTAQTAGRPMEVLAGAAAPEVVPAPVDAGFTYTPGLLKAHRPVTFTAQSPDADGRRFQWLFGDGTRASGGAVKHTFPDAEGSLLDGSGRFRVLLHVMDRGGAESWHSESVVVGTRPLAPLSPGSPPPAEANVLERAFQVPADGGYTLYVLTRAPARVSLDGLPAVASPAPRPVVCDSPEAAAQPVRISAALLAGRHRLRVEMQPGAPAPVLLWEGPGVPRQLLPGASE